MKIDVKDLLVAEAIVAMGVDEDVVAHRLAVHWKSAAATSTTFLEAMEASGWLQHEATLEIRQSVDARLAGAGGSATEALLQAGGFSSRLDYELGQQGMRSALRDAAVHVASTYSFPQIVELDATRAQQIMTAHGQEATWADTYEIQHEVSVRNAGCIEAVFQSPDGPQLVDHLYLCSVIEGIRDGLRFPKVKSLTAETARVLSVQEHGLYLDGLEDLPVDVACAFISESLRRRRIWLMDAPSEEVRAKVASETHGEPWLRQCATNNAMLSLRGLASLSEAAAYALGRHDSDVRLDGLKALSVDAARGLAAVRGSLGLGGLPALSHELAAALGGYAPFSWFTDCAWVDDLAAETRQALIRRQPSLGLGGVTHLDRTMARALAGCRAQLDLRGLTHLPLDVARELARHVGPSILLSGIDRLPREVQRVLHQHRGWIRLGGSHRMQTQRVLGRQPWLSDR